MEEHDIKRKLATILVADIVGFSRLAATDEDWTIRSLRDFRKVVDGIIEGYDGRIFNTGGDSVLAEFASPVQAVRCAVDFQEAARSRSLLQPRDKQLRFRIGINLGDELVSGDDLLGDGVNVAARLEGLAEPGGICVSASVWDHVNGKLSIGYVDLGEQSVKNIPRPVRAYHLRVDGVSEEAKAPVAALPEPATVPAARRSRLPMAAVATALLLVAVGVLVWQFWPKQQSPQTADAGARRPQSAGAGPDFAAPRRELSARVALVLPGYDEKTREAKVGGYDAARPHKAQAASIEAKAMWRATGRVSAENAEAAALEQCQVAFGEPCVLLALNDAVQQVPVDGKWPRRDMPRARYAGEFDPAQIPGASPGLHERPDIAGYRATPEPKAAAFHPNGGRLFVVTVAATQRLAEETALKACNEDPERKGADGQCFLYAVGNRVLLPLRLQAPLTAAPQVAAPASVPATAPAPAGLRPAISARLKAAAPKLGDQAGEGVTRAYETAGTHKALAVSPEPAGSWRAADRPTVENAETSALEACQLVYGQPCVLIATDDAVPPAPDDGRWPRRDMARVRYQGSFDPEQIPGASPAARQRRETMAYRSAAGPKAAAITPIAGRVFTATSAGSQRAAEEAALKACDADQDRRSQHAPCFLYAVGDQVILDRRAKEPITAP